MVKLKKHVLIFYGIMLLLGTNYMISAWGLTNSFTLSDTISDIAVIDARYPTPNIVHKGSSRYSCIDLRNIIIYNNESDNSCKIEIHVRGTLICSQCQNCQFLFYIIEDIAGLETITANTKIYEIEDYLGKIVFSEGVVKIIDIDENQYLVDIEYELEGLSTIMTMILPDCYLRQNEVGVISYIQPLSEDDPDYFGFDVYPNSLSNIGTGEEYEPLDFGDTFAFLIMIGIIGAVILLLLYRVRKQIIPIKKSSPRAKK